MREPRATVDFETRSACDLPTHGTWRYAIDPTTEVLCLAFRLPTWKVGEVALWHPAFPHLGIVQEGRRDLDKLDAWVRKGGLIEAHNAWFERCIFETQGPKFGMARIPDESWRCSAAKAAAHCLPRDLDDALSALRIPVSKDEEGRALMMKMVKPRKPLKRDKLAWRRKHSPCRECDGVGKVPKIKRDGTVGKTMSKCWKCEGRGHSRLKPPPMPLLYQESREEMERLWLYNQQDVRAEEALSQALPDLSENEQTLFLLDAKVNRRGFQLDTEAVSVALRLIDGESVELNAELAGLTGGEVVKATQREALKTWLSDNGLNLTDTRKETIDEITATDKGQLPPWVLRDGANPDVFRVLEIMRTLGRSSTAKYAAMRDWADGEGRVRGGLLYHGASTGRWTGKGVQPHNFVKSAL